MDFLQLINNDGGLPKKSVSAIGIDLGTTNSTVAEAAYDPASGSVRVRCLEIAQATTDGESIHVLVPSVVALFEGKEWVGEGAKRLLARSGEKNLALYKDVFFQCKNEVGTRKEYPRASAGYRSPAEIGGRVLSFLHDSAVSDLDNTPDRAVVTVPASFQVAQRNDTFKACEIAGLDVEGGGLLDEPVAAFLDYLCTYGDQIAGKLDEPKNLVVFDFGGGTCDVAVFEIGMDSHSHGLKLAALSVSRYHRLGGGDIDAAILHDVLVSQLCEQNSLGRHDLGYEEKRRYVEPALMGAAESLKISLCVEMARLRKFGKFDGADKETVGVKLPGVHQCPVGDAVYALQSPELSAVAFERVLEPFIDTDLLFTNEGEYHTTCSIFAPLQDALDRSGIQTDEVDLCLMVGGSSLIPQVVDALGEYLDAAEILVFPDRESIQTAVARGAAYHSLALALTGEGLIQPVAHDDICIRTASGRHILVPKGSALPYPISGDYAICGALAVPDSSDDEPVDIRVELVAGDEDRVLFSEIWHVTPPVRKGDGLCLEYKHDENQVLKMLLALSNGSGEVFMADIENPLTNVVNPQSLRTRIWEIEESIRGGGFSRESVPYVLAELADEYRKIGHREKALALLKDALRRQNGPDAYILNKMGILCGEMGDYDRQAKFYLQAAQSAVDSIPLFNLALSQKDRGENDKALATIDSALDKERIGPSLTLKAMLAERIGNISQKEECLKEALTTFDSPVASTDWELVWLASAARMSGDNELHAAVSKEQAKRRKSGATKAIQDGQLPIDTSEKN